MKILTESVHPDEPCFGYFTGPLQRPGFNEPNHIRMIEQVFVARDGGNTIACWERDLGPASEYGYVPPLQIWTDGDEDHVGECMDEGERHRADPKWARRMIELKEESTLLQDAIRQYEINREIIHNRSQFGPAVSVQRNGWSRERTWRNFKDERSRRTGKTQL